MELGAASMEEQSPLMPARWGQELGCGQGEEYRQGEQGPQFEQNLDTYFR